MRITWILALVLAWPAWSAEFTPISLAPVANRELVDQGKGGWSDQGPDNSLTGFPRGKQTFLNIPFVIPETGPAAVMLQGKKLAKLPESVTVPVPKVSGRWLYLLSTYVWGAEDQVATLTIQYADQTHQDIAIVLGRNVGGWWGPQIQTRAEVAWKGRNGLGQSIGVYLSPLEIKTTNSPIIAISIQAKPQDGSLAVLGLTVGDKPAKEILTAADWQPVDTSTAGWFPMESVYDKDSIAAWESAYQFDAPAGKYGWLIADGQDLRFRGQAPLRFKGANLCAEAIFPPKSEAEHEVRRLVKFGFNQVRIHSIMDVFLTENGGTELNAKRLDKFDYLFAELKKAGIYVNACGLFSHLWKAKEGVAEADKLRSLNNTQYFYDARHQELYLEVLKKFFTHKNPYTGLTYAEDPTLCMYEVLNECSLFFNTTDAVPPTYRVALQDLWNEWLIRRYKGDLGLSEAWRVEGQSSAIEGQNESLSNKTVALREIGSLAHASAGDAKRVADQTRFYYELETGWFHRVEQAIRGFGSKLLLQGSAWGGPGHLQELQTAANAELDFATKHSYWLHPAGGWTPRDVTFKNLPIERSIQDNFFQFTFEHPANKPFGNTEWNFCWPNDYTVEVAPFMAAYGALQNQAVNYRFVTGNVDNANFLNGIFGMFDNPSTIASEPLAYFLYVRGDVQTAPVIYRRALDNAALHDPFRNQGRKENQADSQMYMLFGAQAIPNDAIFAGRVELSFDPQKFPAVWDEHAYQAANDTQRKTLTSLTHELIWNYDRGFIQIDTPRTQGVLGFLDNQTVTGRSLQLKLNNAYGVVHFSSLDAKPLNETKRILVSLVGRTRNTGQQYAKRGENYKLQQQGEAPLLMEPVTADFELQTGHSQWRLRTLDYNGNPRPGTGELLAAVRGKITGKLSNRVANGVYFLLEAQ